MLYGGGVALQGQVLGGAGGHSLTSCSSCQGHWEMKLAGG